MKMKFKVDPTTSDGNITMTAGDLLNLLKKYREDYIIEIFDDTGSSCGISFERADHENQSLLFNLEC